MHGRRGVVAALALACAAVLVWLDVGEGPPPPRRLQVTLGARTADLLGARAPAPVTRFVFIQPHSTGAATLANIFARYGEARGLRFVLPKHNPRLGWPNAFPGEAEQLDPPFDAVVHQAVLSFPKMLAFVPGARFVALVRQPAAQFVSAFYGNSDLLLPGVPRTLTDETADALLHMERPRNAKQAKALRQLSNSQSFSLGWIDFKRRLSNRTDTQREVQSWLAQVVDRLDVVVVVERFDESLVLLAHKFSWPLADVACLPVRPATGDRPTPGPDLMRQLRRRFLRLDEALYAFAEQRLDKQLATLGDAAAVDGAVHTLRRLNDELRQRCGGRDRQRGGGADSSFCWRHVATPAMSTMLLKARAGLPCASSAVAQKLQSLGTPDELEELLRPCRRSLGTGGVLLASPAAPALPHLADPLAFTAAPPPNPEDEPPRPVRLPPRRHRPGAPSTRDRQHAHRWAQQHQEEEQWQGQQEPGLWTAPAAGW